jgi:FkbM family methyltransferase
MDIREYERIVPVMMVEGVNFFTPNSVCVWRVSTFHTKEPDTVAWLRSMQPGEMLFDVGANVGMYAVYAASRGVRVLAFEPEAQNYAVLCRNAQINQLQNLVAFPVALAGAQKIDTLRITDVTAGNSCNTFGADVDYRGQAATFPFQQGALAMPMDAFATRYGNPDYIKIDVDGLEHEVVTGGRQSIASAKSVLIEIDSGAPQHMALFELMRSQGFAWDDAQIEAARRKDGAFKGIGNVIFEKRS